MWEAVCVKKRGRKEMGREGRGEGMMGVWEEGTAQKREEDQGESEGVREE